MGRFIAGCLLLLLSRSAFADLKHKTLFAYDLQSACQMNIKDTGSYYHIQLGSFKNESYALKLKNQYHALFKLPVYIQYKNGFYQVVLGPISQQTLSSNLCTSPEKSKSIPIQPVANAKKIQRLPLKLDFNVYDPETYRLAYKVFVLNGDVKLAYEVAKTAVEYQPQDITWRKKLAQAAMWAGYPNTALAQWMYFIEHNINVEHFINKALPLAKKYSDYSAIAKIYKVKLEKEPNNQQLSIAYAKALRNQGRPEHAMKVLRKMPNALKNKEILLELSSIATDFNQTDLQLTYLNRLIALEPKTVRYRLQKAHILYSVGDYSGAFDIYSEIAVLLKPKKINFWKNYAQMALLTGHITEVRSAYEILLKSGKISEAEMQALIYFQTQAGQLESAYQTAQLAYEKYNSFSTLKSLLLLASSLERWSDVMRIINQLSSKEQQTLNRQPEFAILFALAYQQSGLFSKASDQWEYIWKHWGGRQDVQTNYLWFLIDQDQNPQLKYILQTREKQLMTHPGVWEAYTAALIKLGNYKKALTMMQKHVAAVKKDYAGILSLADLYTQRNNAYQAYFLQRRAFYLLLNELASQKTPPNLRQKLALAELLRRFAPASLVYHNILVLSKNLRTIPEIDNQIIAWSLDTYRYSLARAIMRSYNLMGQAIPAWMQQTLSLEENDQDNLLYLLENKAEVLPYRDRVMSATRIHEFKKAEEYAYTGLKDHPFDRLMYDLFNDTMLPRSNVFSLDMNEQVWGNVLGPYFSLKNQWYATPSLTLTPFAEGWFPHSNDQAIFFTTPSKVGALGITARQYVKRGWVEAETSIRQGLDPFLSLGFDWRYEHLIPRLHLNTSLKYHAKAEETTALVLGGMKNEAKIGLNYLWDSSDFFDLEGSFAQFMGQDNTSLGQGGEIRWHWQHKFYLDYPDWNINLYSSWRNYQNKNKLLPPFLAQLAPVGSQPDAAFYMPLNDKDVAITVGFGQAYYDEYTHNLKPFAEVGVLQSSAFGFGQLARCGIAVSVFGRDHLVLFADYSRNQQQVQEIVANQPLSAQTFYTIGINYDYYY